MIEAGARLTFSIGWTGAFEELQGQEGTLASFPSDLAERLGSHYFGSKNRYTGLSLSSNVMEPEVETKSFGSLSPEVCIASRRSGFEGRSASVISVARWFFLTF